MKQYLARASRRTSAAATFSLTVLWGCAASNSDAENPAAESGGNVAVAYQDATVSGPNVSGDAAGPVAPSASGTAGGVGGAEAGASAMTDAGNRTDASAAAEAGTAPPDAGRPSGATTGTLPPITDAWAKGPYTVVQLDRAGPQSNASVLYPKELGKDGVKHPIAVWGNGAGATGPDPYRMVTTHVASHGIAVYITNQSTNAGTELVQGIDWMIAENGRSGSAFEGKLDTTKVASMGHSMGALATFAIGKDPRLTTTVHLSGGTMGTHDAVNNLHAPAAFICGEYVESSGILDILGPGDIATANCRIDYMNAKVPVFYAEANGLSHATGYNMMHGAVAGWLRWQLAGDTSMKKMFVGPDCDLCKRPMWKVQTKNNLM